jgi:predicted molibdopterin-dependent oxidoreductase YjgC
MEDKNVIVINNNEFSFERGETILEVATKNNIEIPILCYLKGASPSSRCGMCVVEIKGDGSLARACSTKAENGMNIFTESFKVITERKNRIKTLLSSGNHNCTICTSERNNWTEFQLKVQEDDAAAELCPAWGDCRLQDLAYKYQITGEKHPEFDKISDPMETVNPFIIRDFSRCILCGRCVKACREIQVNDAIDFKIEGDKIVKVIAKDDLALKNSDCVFCGECVQACPVGALVEKEAKYNVRPWEEKKVKTTCSYCGVGCQLFLHVKDDKVVRVTGDTESAPNYGSLCVKGRFGFDFINSEERLKTPLIRKNGKLEESSWADALNFVAQKLTSIKNEFGSDSMGVLTSARITNEENYIIHKFTRSVLKTNNIDHCARL